MLVGREGHITKSLAAAKVPAGHLEQEPEPDEGENSLRGHAMHLPESLIRNDPA